MTSQLQFTRPPTEPDDFPGVVYVLALVGLALVLAGLGVFMWWVW